MCGIVGYVGKRNAQDVLLDGLEKLEYRGYDSAGVALALEGGIRVVKSKGRLAELRKRLAVEAPGPERLRHRPHPVGDPRGAQRCEQPPAFHARVSIVHNGIIENYGCAEGAAHGQGPYL